MKDILTALKITVATAFVLGYLAGLVACLKLMWDFAFYLSGGMDHPVLAGVYLACMLLVLVFFVTLSALKLGAALSAKRERRKQKALTVQT